MKPASAYFQKFAWSVHSFGTEDTFGEPPDEYTDGGTLWGYLDTPSSSRANYLEADTNTQIGFVHLRGFVSVKMDDTLTDSRFSEAWEVLSVHRDVVELETIAEVRRRGS